MKPYNIRTTVLSPGAWLPSYRTVSPIRTLPRALNNSMPPPLRFLRTRRILCDQPATRCGYQRDRVQADQTGTLGPVTSSPEQVDGQSGSAPPSQPFEAANGQTSKSGPSAARTPYRSRAHQIRDVAFESSASEAIAAAGQRWTCTRLGYALRKRGEASCCRTSSSNPQEKCSSFLQSPESAY